MSLWIFKSRSLRKTGGVRCCVLTLCSEPFSPGNQELEYRRLAASQAGLILLSDPMDPIEEEPEGSQLIEKLVAGGGFEPPTFGL